ncbi:MAG: hypothetical protein HY235_08695 [Acidobacteria bacterium]|nr:hypothetical protein [Acidobacteriota bacterium]
MANRVEQFYNVDAAVGKGKQNIPEDVLLVRFFLSQIKGSGVAQVIGFNPPGSLPVVPAWDQQLTDWIIAFQSVMAPTTRVPVDGIVDSARGTSSQRSTITKSIYTIALLNNAYRTNQKQSHAALWLDPRVPPTLRKALLDNVR